MRIAIFGANGATGRHLTRAALRAGHDLTVLVRRPDSFPFRDERVRVVGGDTLVQGDVDAAIEGADAVLSAVGVPFSRGTIEIYSGSAEHVVAAMTRRGVRRLAVVSSSAVEAHEPTEGWVFERVLQPMVVNGIGRTTYDDMRRMEEVVSASGLDWTIVRPSGLFPADAPSRYRSSTAHAPGRFTARPDLADFLLRQATEPEWIRTRPEVHTDEGTPSTLSVIWNEGIRHRPDPILLAEQLVAAG